MVAAKRDRLHCDLVVMKEKVTSSAVDLDKIRNGRVSAVTVTTAAVSTELREELVRFKEGFKSLEANDSVPCSNVSCCTQGGGGSG